MDTMDGYTKAAVALQEVDEQEREWFLAQLDEEDRCRITTLLQEMTDSRGLSMVDTIKRAVRPQPPAGNENSYAAIIEGAPVDTLEAILDVQPDWAIALILVDLQKSSALHQYVSHLTPSRADRIRALLKPSRDSVKPKVRDVVLRSIAGQIERHKQETIEGSEFESVLMRVAG